MAYTDKDIQGAYAFQCSTTSPKHAQGAGQGCYAGPNEGHDHVATQGLFQDRTPELRTRLADTPTRFAGG